MWMCLVYRNFNGVISVSISMELYLHISQVWLKFVLDDGPNVIMWFI